MIGLHGVLFTRLSTGFICVVVTLTVRIENSLPSAYVLCSMWLQFDFQPTAQQSDKRSTTKAEKGKSTPAAIEKPSKDLTAEKDTKKSSKKKAQSPAAAKPTTSKSEVRITLNSLQ